MGVLFPCGFLSKAVGISCWVFNHSSIAFLAQMADVLRSKSSLSVSHPLVYGVLQNGRCLTETGIPFMSCCIVGLPDLAYKSAGCSVKVEFQFYNKYIFKCKHVPQSIWNILTWKIILYLRFKFNWVCPECVFYLSTLFHEFLHATITWIHIVIRIICMCDQFLKNCQASQINPWVDENLRLDLNPL